MSYAPISTAPIQYSKASGEPANGYYLKFYVANSTTPITMQTDSGGATSLAKCKLNESGFPISNPADENTVFIPHLNTTYEAYRFVIYPNAADADANNVSAGLPNIQSVNTINGVFGQVSVSSDDVTFAPAIVGGVSTPLVDNLENLLTPFNTGAVGDQVTNDTTAVSSWLTSGKSLFLPKSNILANGVIKKTTTPTFVNADSSNHSAGMYALESITSGNENTAFGNSAGKLNASGNQNSAFGKGALSSVSGTSGHTAVGFNALATCTTGVNNTAIGSSALSDLVSYTNCSGVGQSAQVTGDNQVQLGNSSTTTYVYGTVQNRSDLRDKADVRDSVLGLEFINALRPVDFKWDLREDYKGAVKDGSKTRSRYHHGLIAQEVKSVCQASGVDFGGFQDHSFNGGQDVLSIGYDELIAPLIKAIQQLSAEIAALKAGSP